MSVVSVVCYVEVSATSRSLVQRSPTDCGASFCVTWQPHKYCPRWAAAPQGAKKIWNQNIKRRNASVLSLMYVPTGLTLGNCMFCLECVTLVLTCLELKRYYFPTVQ